MKTAAFILVTLLLLAAGTYLIVQSTSELSQRLKTQTTNRIPEGNAP